MPHRRLRRRKANSYQLSSNLHEAALIDDTDTVGQLLRFFQVVGGQDDGHPAIAERPHVIPEVVPQLDIDTGSQLNQPKGCRMQKR